MTNLAYGTAAEDDEITQQELDLLALVVRDDPETLEEPFVGHETAHGKALWNTMRLMSIST